jgi:hypothetical protein
MDEIIADLKKQGYQVITDKGDYVVAAHYDREFVDILKIEVDTGTKEHIENLYLSELAQIVAKGLGA